jgi:hypothetical protein
MLVATGFPLTRMPVRLAQGKAGRGRGDLSIGRPLRISQQPTRAYTHSSLQTRQMPGSHRLGSR